MGKDIEIGEQYGRWTVLHEGSKLGKDKRYLCRCSCGTVREVLAQSLKSGESKSCGCLRNEQKKAQLGGKHSHNFKSLVGKRFGLLTVLRVDEKRMFDGKGKAYYECMCDCGNITSVSTANLISGHTKSCGCISRGNHTLLFEQNLRAEYVDNTCLYMLNDIPSKNNTSGRKGVYWSSSAQRWRAQITFQKKRRTLGDFKNFDDACKAREQAEKELFEPMLKKHGR